MNMAIWYDNFIAVRNEKHKVIRFEAKPGAELLNVVKDVVKYLKFHDLKKDYLLIFNKRGLIINQISNATDVVDEYSNINNINL